MKVSGRQTGAFGLGSRKEINPLGLRRIWVRLQGAPKGAYLSSVTIGATRKTGPKTSKIVDLFLSTALNKRFASETPVGIRGSRKQIKPIGPRTISLGGVIGRHRITMRLPLSILAKLIL
jgi:hypothetical protein